MWYAWNLEGVVNGGIEINSRIRHLRIQNEWSKFCFKKK